MRKLAAGLPGLFLFLLAARLTGATVAVNDAGDATNACAATGVGTCTLRDALTYANAHASSTVAFNISGPGVHTIQPATPYPALLATMTIDGFTQPGASPNSNGPGLGDNSVHLIEIDGTHTGAGNPAAFDFGTGSNGSVVRGLVMNRCPAAIRVAFSTTSGHVIEGNFLGTDPTGTIASANEFDVLIDIAAANVTIGGITPASRNLLSGAGAGSASATEPTTAAAATSSRATSSAPTPREPVRCQTASASRCTVASPARLSAATPRRRATSSPETAAAA